MDPRSMMSRRGSTSMLVLFGVVVLVGVSAVAIDAQRARMVRMELHNAAEAAAHAAALGLDGTTAGFDDARERAALAALANYADGAAVDLDLAAGEPAAVELGRYEGGVFVADTSDPAEVKAVRVNLRLPEVRAFFGGPAFGTDTLAVSTEVRVLGGGPSDAGCPLPVAVPSCSLPEGDAICNMDVVMGPDGNDNGAWARIGSATPNASYVKSALRECAAESSTVDLVSLNNGMIAAAAKELATVIDESTDTWDPAEWGAMPTQFTNSAVTNYGNVLVSQLIVYKDAGDCSNPKMTGSRHEIEGYATAVVYDVITTGKAAGRKVAMRVVCDSTTARAGGGFFGTKAPPQFF